MLAALCCTEIVLAVLAWAKSPNEQSAKTAKTTSFFIDPSERVYKRSGANLGLEGVVCVVSVHTPTPLAKARTYSEFSPSTVPVARERVNVTKVLCSLAFRAGIA